MKARIPPTKKQIKVLEGFAKQEIEKQRVVICRKIFKVIFYVLNVEFGFGAKRINEIVKRVTELLAEAETDELFFEHLDRHIIDRVGVDFERDYSDL